MTKQRLTKEEKALQAKVDAIVETAIQNVQIGIFDLGKIPDEGMRAAREYMANSKGPHSGLHGLSLDEAIRVAVIAIVKTLSKDLYEGNRAELIAARGEKK